MSRFIARHANTIALAILMGGVGLIGLFHILTA